jgi:hypothetical protein
MNIHPARLLFASATAGLFSTSALAQTTYERTLQSKSCSEQKRNQQLDCDYKLGADFWLSIAGVGSPVAGISFMKSEFKGQFYGTVAVSHGCVVVKPGSANKVNLPHDMAFISPRNGKVYRDWPSCKAAN